jgi:DNA repair protein RadC
MNEDGTDASGHRGRLRKRLIEGGPEALLDHELVEYLLALTIPRRDTKPLARQLLKEFGGIGALLSADAEALGRQGLSEAAIAAVKIAEASALRLLRARVAEREVLSTSDALIAYLTADAAHRLTERVRVLYLNARNMLIRDELLSEGTVDEASVHVREVIRRALDLGAAAIILVHNHPSGDPQPSRQDIALTREIVDAGRPLRIAVHDHVVIGAHGHSSLRAMGLM